MKSSSVNGNVHGSIQMGLGGTINSRRGTSTSTSGLGTAKSSNNNNRIESSPSSKSTASRERQVPTKTTSPVKQPSVVSRPGHGHNKTPSRSMASSTRDSAVVAAGGLGRMDIAAQDWDGTTTNSTGTSPQKKRTTSVKQYDRFIPSRENSAGTIENNNPKKATTTDDSFDEGESKASESVEGQSFSDSPPPTPHNGAATAQEASSDQAHTAELSSSLGIELGRRILSFSAEPPPASNEHSSLLAAYARGETGGRPGSSQHQSALAASQRRRIATTPDRVLDAPGLVDDYYLNLLDWSSTNLLAIALAESVYIWNGDTGDVGCLCSINSNSNTSEAAAAAETEEIVCSVKFSDDGSYLAIGTSIGSIQIYDLSTSTRIRTMSGHATRIPSLSWSGAILSSGSRDGSIWNSDVRVASHKVGEMRGHRAEVCGLEWRKDTSSVGTNSGGGMGLLASGGNDNIVNVWDGRMLNAPKMVKSNHTAAVKAIAWCPWQSSLLATGGGSSDRTIHFWNTTTSARLNSLVTPSQVTSLRFNPHSREVLSSHGFPDHNLSIWTYPTLTKVIDITQAHETRILHTCLNPDGTTLATASSDENLKFWKVFDLPKKSAAAGGGSTLGGSVGKTESKSGDEMGRRGRTGIAIR